MEAFEIKSILSKLGKKPDKLLGQHFLMDETVLQDMLEAGKVEKGETVVEVGPGLGVLTELLSKRAREVIAVEKDTSLKNYLSKKARSAGNVKLIFADVLQIDFSSIGLTKYKVVANLPYYITAPIINHFLNAKIRPLSLTLLVQKEVAENMVAKKGKMNLLALAVKLKADVRLVRVVPARAFFPAPKVESAVVQLDVFSKPLVSKSQEKVLFRVAKGLFKGKRKQIHNTLKSNLALSESETKLVLEQARLGGQERPEHLSTGQFIQLGEALSELEKQK